MPNNFTPLANHIPLLCSGDPMLHDVVYARNEVHDHSVPGVYHILSNRIELNHYFFFNNEETCQGLVEFGKVAFLLSMADASLDLCHLSTCRKIEVTR